MIAPRMRPLGNKRSTIVAALDIGTSKVACVIAKLKAERGREMPRNRTHSVEIIGIGLTRAFGIKAGTVVDIEAAEDSIRRAVDQAERSAKVEIASVILSVTGGRLGSESFAASVRVPGSSVEGGDIARVLDAASLAARCCTQFRSLITSMRSPIFRTRAGCSDARLQSICMSRPPITRRCKILSSASSAAISRSKV
jgi:hypothetical protein